MSISDRSWQDLNCTNCDYIIFVQDVDLRLFKTIYCPNCKNKVLPDKEHEVVKDAMQQYKHLREGYVPF
jgi:DNA-directed RNA polymerase subunit RPC12/RpoP